MTQAVNVAALGSPGVATGFKNRIINGGMTIDQRNAGASTTPTSTSAAVYCLDRWATYGSVASKFSVQQNAGSVTPPAGFTNYLGITSLSAYTPSSSDQIFLQQYIEGYNVADLAWGTADAKTITISFWVRSSLTGTFGGALENGSGNRSYAFTYVINSANTWEQKTVTIAGDTTGTWATNNATGIQCYWNLGCGSTYSKAAGSWGTGNVQNATGSVSVVGTNGATWYLTGVQLEVGTTATTFDFRSYGTELALCQRYYQTYGNVSYAGIGVGVIASSGNIAKMGFTYPVTMRATPSATSANLIATDRVAYDTNLTAIQQFVPSNNGMWIGWNLASTTGAQGWATGIAVANGTTGYLNLSAEL